MADVLLKGLADFKHYHYDGEQTLMDALVKEGQSPKYFIVSCIDSRCNPGTIFRAQPGSFFAHKAMGAIVRPYQQGTALAAALQFALDYNKVDTLVILGHTECGAVKALVENLEDPEIKSFIEVAEQALAKAKSCCSTHDEILARTEQEVVLESVENLKSYPAVARALEDRRVTIKPWIFDIRTGNILEHNADDDKFVTITPKTSKEDSRQHA